MIKRIILLALVSFSGFAQSSFAADTAAALADGTAFANGIVATAPSQMVNPAAVNAAAWNNGSIPTAAPANMGAFSNPSTNSSTYTSASSLGLTGIGLQTQSNCANYVQGTDPLMDQQCAAVNFMSNNCLTLTPAETAVLGSVPGVSAGNTNCSGTYGQGSSRFNYGNQITSSDPIFSTINTAQSTAETTLAGTCSPQTVVTKPAQYATNNCIVSLTTSPMGCSQSMNCTTVVPASVPATPTYSCAAGSVLIGTQCQPPAFAATVNYSCSTGSTLNGTSCQPAPTSATLSYSCVSGTLSGSTCIQPALSATLTYSCPAGSSLSGTNCQAASINASVTYSCPAGSTLSGTSCQAAAYQPAGSAATATTTTTYIMPSNYTNCGPGLRRPGACPAGYKDITCGKNTAGNVWLCIAPTTTTTYSCPSGYTLSGTTCYPPMVTPPPTAATATYACPLGYTLSGTTCVAPNTTATPNYSCPVNYSLSGTSCITPSTAATASYSCPTGTLSGTSCVQPPIGATVSYTCPIGNTLTSTSCQPPNIAATVTYSCGQGMTLSGSSCIPTPIATCTWSDNCGPFSTSAGSALPTP